MSLDGVPLVNVVAVSAGWLDDVAMFIFEASSCWWLVQFCHYVFVLCELSCCGHISPSVPLCHLVSVLVFSFQSHKT